MVEPCNFLDGTAIESDGKQKLLSEYSVNVTLMAARDLPSADKPTLVGVRVQNHKRYTRIKQPSDRPFFREYFVFDLKTTDNSFMETVIKFTVYSVSSKLHKRKTLGSVRLGVGTVWAQPGHEIVGKWLQLRDKKRGTSESCGYLKVTVSLSGGTSSSVEHHPLPLRSLPYTPVTSHSDQDISANLFNPGEKSGKDQARYCFRIYRGVGLKEWEKRRGPKMFPPKNSSFTSSVKVHFAGLSAETSGKKNKGETVWNQELVFNEAFPTMYDRIRLQLKTSDNIANKYIHLAEVTDPRFKGHLPSYGPTFVHFFEPPFNFVGSVLLSLQTKTVSAFSQDEKFRTVKKRTLQPLDEDDYWVEEEFLVLGALFEISMLDPNMTEKPQTTQLTINFGASNPEKKPNLEYQLLKTGNLTTVDMGGQTLYQGTLPMTNKPCLYLRKTMPDNRQRDFTSNRLATVARQFKEMLRDVYGGMDASGNSKGSSELSKAFRTLKERCRTESQAASSGTTLLDRERAIIIRKKLEKIVSDINQISSKASFKVQFDKALDVLEKLYDIIEDPQESFPPVLLCVWNDGKMIAYVSVPTVDIMFSDRATERGYGCGTVRSYQLKKVTKKKAGFGGKIDIYLWFGPYSAVGYCLETLPPGHADYSALTAIPTEIQYYHNVEFIFRAHISKGYLEPYGTMDGFFNPFVIVMVAHQVGRTKTVKRSICPSWKETISLNIQLSYGDYYYFKRNLIAIICEVWHEGKGGNVLIGRCCAVPHVILKSDNLAGYPPMLKWYKIATGTKSFGEILAMFELIQPVNISSPLDGGELDPETSKLKEILENENISYPHTNKLRLEVLFWGVRKMEGVGLSEVNHPIAVAGCGDAMLSTEIMRNSKRYPNFVGPPAFAEIEVDDVRMYAPPLVVRMYDTRDFGLTTFVGSHVVKDIHQYLVKLPTKKQWERINDRYNDNVGFKAKNKKEKLDNLPKADEPNIDEETRDETPRRKSIVNYKEENPSKQGVQGLRKVLYFSSSELTKFQVFPNPDKEIKYFDWWTKYYRSLENLLEATSGTKSLKMLKRKNRKGKVPQIQIYLEELEKQPEFGGFRDALQTMDIMRTNYKGRVRRKCVAKLKACIKIYAWPCEDCLTPTGDDVASEGVTSPLYQLMKEPLGVTVRVYIVRCHNLYTRDKSRAASPYFVLSLNSTTYEDSKARIVEDSNPTVGRCYELKARFPFDPLLTLKVMDYERPGLHSVIGETTIDIENRYFSKHRATCGLPTHYNAEGYNRWRDVKRPSEILEELCSRYKLQPPLYLENTLIVATIKVRLLSTTADLKENLALKALSLWYTVPGLGVHLVPEHVEIRTLYHPERPEVERGKVEMWVDILGDGTVPLPGRVPVEPRQPEEYVLRVIVWKTARIKLLEEGVLVGKKHGDIFIKGWLDGRDVQKTDVHYMCTTGDAQFNWRFVFAFSYIPAEGMILARKKLMTRTIETKEPPILHIQAVEKDRITENRHIGSLEVNLRRVPKGAFRLVWVHARLIRQKRGVTDLFQVRRIRAWWPLLAPREANKQKCVGLIDLELHLLTKDENDIEPAGKGRSPPEKLPEPVRPRLKKSLWLAPFRAMNRYCLQRYKKKLTIYGLILLAIIFVLVALYALPQYTVKKILGA